MSFTLEAILLDKAATRHAPDFPTVVLSKGITLLPVTDDVFDQVAATSPSSETRGPFWKLSGALEALIIDVSRHGRVAYIEADYFGGTGTQSAAVWHNGWVIMEPEHANGIGPINRALSALGVIAAPGQDEFDAVKLGRHRRTSAWTDEAPKV